MGQTKVYPPVKLFAAIMISDTEIWPKILHKLEKLYSDSDLQMNWYSFHHSNYYKEEMGKKLSKRMVSFADLIWAEKLIDIKLTTNDLEMAFARNNKRIVNIDPGYLTASKIVLATTKNYSHRIYLGRGIFGDVHLKFQKHQFQANEWTYPDYKEAFVVDFFEKMRNKYMTQLSNYKF
jgi:hypothetical protein